MNVVAYAQRQHTPLQIIYRERERERTNSLHGLHHTTANQINGQPAATKRRNSHLALDPAEPGTLLATLLQDAHAPELVENVGLDLLAHRVAVRV